MPDDSHLQQILSALSKLDNSVEKLNTRVNEFRDEFKHEVLKTSERVITLEGEVGQFKQSSQRFQDITWPTHERYAEMVETRVRQLEMQATALAKVSDLDRRFDEMERKKDEAFKEVNAFAKGLETQIEAVSLKAEKSSWSVGLFNAGIALVVSAGILVLFEVLFKK